MLLTKVPSVLETPGPIYAPFFETIMRPARATLSSRDELSENCEFFIKAPLLLI